LGTFLLILLSNPLKIILREDWTMKTIFLFLLFLVLWVSASQAGCLGEAAEVRILTDDGRALPVYPVKTGYGVRKVYAEAVKGDQYRIEVRNRFNRRIGLVIAVDGRNIISGAKSWLKGSERMYILEPYGTGVYAGWRSAQDRINRFYFTDVQDSYAGAFGDESAMGVIAVAVYPEVIRYEPPAALSRVMPSPPGEQEGRGTVRADKGQPHPAAPGGTQGSLEKKAARSERALENAGTGYGREEYSPSRVVTFEPEEQAAETHFFKYEWRSTLCRVGVIRCTPYADSRPNRLWDQEGYAPPPPVSFRR
jgi:hypothetical protein